MMKDLMHSGVAHDDNPPGRGSGRYGYGSGENPFQHEHGLIADYNRLKSRGISDGEIAKALLGEKAKSSDLKAELSIAKAEQRKIKISVAQNTLDKCNGNASEAARRLGINESSLRSLLDPVKAARTDRYRAVADKLEQLADEKGMIDVSKNVDIILGVPKNTMDVAIKIAEKDGYLKSWVKMPQLTTPHDTTMVVLAKPGTTHADVQEHKYDIKPIQDFSPDGGSTWWTPEYPTSVDSKRVFVRYAEDGGKDRDGCIELRPGVKDLDLGGPHYSQVRIAVDGTNYLKGMAVYSNDVPDGYDIVVNTNKHRGTPLIDKTAKYDSTTDSWSGKEVTKRMKMNPKTGEIDKDNPFGASIKNPKDRDGILSAGGQRHYTDADGNDKLSPINRLQDEGDWDGWSRNLSAQFLSKQPIKLIKQQINISTAAKEAEYSKIMELTNPVIKKKMLNDFADGCDSKAASLSVKGFKGQSYQVILPVPGLKDNEIYAPNYKDGDTVALVRYPHGGPFEIPVLTVNNKSKAGETVVGKLASDAVGINPRTAEVLSGADFDGDFVSVIPVKSNHLSIAATKPLEGLVGFDPKELYKLPDDAPKVKNKTKQQQMGIVTNLITDMTAQGASPDEIERAVKHSMVVIDSEKHHLDYKQSAIDNNIPALQKKYQLDPETGKSGGAKTIFSRAGATVWVNERKEVTDVKKMTPEQRKRWDEGYKVYVDTGRTRKTKIDDPSIMTPDELTRYRAGKKVYRDTNIPKQVKISRMENTDDAFTLVHNKDNEKEVAYANYANNLKQMGRNARSEARKIKAYPVNEDAKKVYAPEVSSLHTKLRVAKSNSPKERTALVIANQMAAEKRDANPNMDAEHRSRMEAGCLNTARSIVGAKKQPVQITDREWEAIQAHAVSSSVLDEILKNTDQEAFKKRATPRKSDKDSLSSGEMSLVLAMANSGQYTQKEIAERLNVSPSTISQILRNSK